MRDVLPEEGKRKNSSDVILKDNGKTTFELKEHLEMSAEN